MPRITWIHLSAVESSGWTRLGPGGALFAVVPRRAEIPVTLIHWIANYATTRTIVAGVAIAGIRRQTVAVAVPFDRISTKAFRKVL